jgi:uncharacterized protein (UPF0261 family)
MTLNVGTKRPPLQPVDIDLYGEMGAVKAGLSRDEVIREVISRGRSLVQRLYEGGEISGIISAGGGTGTYISTSIMQVLPLGVPKVMVSTVASRDMSETVGVKDITMMHSVSDILGINTITGRILDNAAGAVCGMVKDRWKTVSTRKRVALSFFGFITRAAEQCQRKFGKYGLRSGAFSRQRNRWHGHDAAGGRGVFSRRLGSGHPRTGRRPHGRLLRRHWEKRFEPVQGQEIPRLIIPGGMDCIVLEFTRDNIPPQFENRKIFFYDFRSAIRVDSDESRLLAAQLSEKLNMDPKNVRVLIPLKGFSEADQATGPLHDPATTEVFVKALKDGLIPDITVESVDLHINDASFAKRACSVMDEMIKISGKHQTPDSKQYQQAPMAPFRLIHTFLDFINFQAR